MQEHSKLSPSSAHRWINCPGSIKLSESASPQKPNIYAAEGTFAHMYAADLWKNKLWHTKYKWDKQIIDGFEISSSEELNRTVWVYLDFLRSLMQEWLTEPQIEQRVVVDEELGLYGTSDAILYVPYNRLIVVDFKYGAGIRVSAWENPQLMYYALGALLAIPEDERAEIPFVEMVIVQPRGLGDAIERFEMKTSDLLAWLPKLIGSAIATDLTKIEPPLLNPGDWCKYCPAAPICPALRKLAKETAQIAFGELDFSAGSIMATVDPHTGYIVPYDPKPPSPKDLDVEVLTNVLNKADIIRDWLKAVEQYALEKLERKEEIPGYCLKEKWGNRKWKNEKEAYYQLHADGFEAKDILSDPKLLSPAQIEKVFKVDLSALVEKPFNGYALTKGDAKLTTTQKAFSTIGEENNGDSD